MFTQSTRISRTTFIQALLISAVAVTFLAACSTAPRTVDDRSDLRTDANSALSLARSGHSSFDSIIRGAPGFAVFPSVGKGGAVVGGAYGRGIVYKSGTQIGYTDLSQATIGLQLGGQAYTEILVFESVNALDKFRKGNYQFSSQATAVALKSGEGTNAKFEDGVAVFTMDEAGLMFEAAVGGQRFSYEAFAPI
jgi:lipid-binding SYLF domain-containing protein